ncbi:MAG: redoxin domain-containing protein [Cyclobacteriaceae bacterium]
MEKTIPWPTISDMHKILFLLIFTAGTYCGFAQEPDVREFNSTDVVTGNNLSLLSYLEKKGVVLLFISNTCPYAQYYEDRIKSMVDTYREQDIAFLLVNSHLDNDESPSSMKRMWESWNIDIPYLADKSQNLQRTFDIRKSPTAVILKPVNEGFSIYYSGKIDNNPLVENDVKEAFLQDNIRSLLENKPPVHANNQPVGCMIR